MLALTKKVTTLAVVASFTSVLSCSIVWANDNNHQQQGQRHQGKHIEKLFQRLDSDQSGALSYSEFSHHLTEHVAKIIERKDADEDGMLNFEEFNQTRRGKMIDYSDIATDIVQCVADIKNETGNNDIVIPSVDKFASPEDKFATLDTNNDGLLNVDEITVAKTTHLTNKFNAIDNDSSGELSLEEFTQGVKAKKATRRAVHNCIEQLTEDDEE